MKLNNPVGYRRDGRPIWPIRGGSEPPNQPPPAATFTQEQLNAIIARETAKERDKGKADGITAATAEIEKTLGMPVADIAALLKEQKERDDAAKTEAQKALEKANREAATAATTTAQAKAALYASRAELHLIRAGLAIPADAKPDAVTAILTRVRGMLTVGTDATEEQIAADVDTLKTAFPALFTPAPAGTGKPPSSDPARKPGTPGTGPVTGLAAGLARAQAQGADTKYSVPAWGRRPT